MVWRKQTDVILNVILPLLVGAALYFTSTTISWPAFIKAHAADALWAYAFASSLLIAWNRSVPYYWLVAAILTAIAFEVLQYLAIIPGTGDILDVVTYIVSFILALAGNNYFKHYQTLKNAAHEKT